MLKVVYTVAGSEATGGAGYQVDLKTFQRLGVYGVGTLTCIVSFDPKNDWNHRFVPVDPQVIAEQMEATLATHNLETAKIGMLGHPDTIEVVAEKLATQTWKNLVVDPVLFCKGQEGGFAASTDKAIREKIIPLATAVTPNYSEACILAQMEALYTVEDLCEAAKRIADLGPQTVFIKGGLNFRGDDAVDVLWHEGESHVLRAPKLGAQRVHGAGCTLAAAIAAELAKETPVLEAAKVAKALVYAGIKQPVRSNYPLVSVWQGAPFSID